jgi:hypothetical protein
MSITFAIPLTEVKACSCGEKHKQIPVGARLVNNGDDLDGFYWDCHCKSTLFVPIKKVRGTWI